MTHIEPPLDPNIDPHTLAKTPFTLAAERGKGAKYNSRTLVLALGALGFVVARRPALLATPRTSSP